MKFLVGRLYFVENKLNRSTKVQKLHIFFETESDGKMVCYNCGFPSHYSRGCNKEQRFSRCNSCGNVCPSEAAHKFWCTEKQFISQRLVSTQNASPVTVVLEIDFHSIRSVSFMDIDVEYQITEMPLFVHIKNQTG